MLGRVLIGGLAAALVAVADASAALGADGALRARQDVRPSHFKCYAVARKQVDRTVTLTDQFERKRTVVIALEALCNPVEKNGELVRDERVHLACYAIRNDRGEPPFTKQRVIVRNQLGVEVLTVDRPRTLCVPSLKREGTAPPPAQPDPGALVDHFKCYEVTASGTFAQREVTLRDQFGRTRARVLRPATLCTPVRKNAERLRQSAVHLKCYAIQDEGFEPGRVVTVRNQLGVETLRVLRPRELCVPSTKQRIPTRPFGARCRPKLAIQHGGAGNLFILPNPGSAPILSTQLAGSQPTNTPDYRFFKFPPGHRFGFRSKRVHPLGQTKLHILLVRVKFGTPGNIVANITVKCEVRVDHPGAVLSVTVGGEAGGRVVSEPAGISCPPECRSSFSGGEVTLKPIETELVQLGLWGGDCSGRDRCTVTMDRDRNVTAVFAKRAVRLTVAVAGPGTVTSSPPVILCGSGGNDCAASFDAGTRVTLAASPDQRSVFTGWGGDDCTGTGDCTLTMNADKSVTATFERGTYARGLHSFDAWMFDSLAPRPVTVAGVPRWASPETTGRFVTTLTATVAFIRPPTCDGFSVRTGTPSGCAQRPEGRYFPHRRPHRREDAQSD